MSHPRIGQGTPSVNVPTPATATGEVTTAELATSDTRTAESRAITTSGTCPSVTGPSPESSRALEGPEIRTPSLPGRVSSPAIIADPTDLAGRVQQGSLELSIPMTGGAKLGLVKVRPDTNLVVRMEVADGQLVRKHTCIEFERADGSKTDLDGPLWWNCDKLYIDESGKLRAEVPCYPDPDITETIMGPGIKKLPQEPDELVRVLTGIQFMPSELPLIGAQSTDFRLPPPACKPTATDASAAAPTTPGSTTAFRSSRTTHRAKPEGVWPRLQPRFGAAAAAALSAGGGGSGTSSGSVSPVTPPPSSATSATAEPTTRSRTDKATKKGGATPPASDPMNAAFQMDKLKLRIDGVLRDGAVRLGDGAVINVQQGSRVTCNYTPEGVASTIDARVGALQMEAQGSRLRTGPGRCRMSIDMQGTKTDLKINEGDFSNFELVTPGATGSHVISAKHVAFTSPSADKPPMSFHTDDANSAFAMDLGQAKLEGLKASFELLGSDGQPAGLTLGDGNTDLTASVRYDSARCQLDFDSDVQNLDASLTSMSLIDSPSFDMALGGGTVRGSARVSVHGRGNATHLKIDALGDKPIEITASLTDAHIGKSAGLPAMVDVAPESTGKLSLRTLEVKPGVHPIIAGTAAVDVKLDGVHLPLGNGRALDLPAGTAGTLIIDDMQWAEADRSPTVRAKLRLEVGPNTSVSAADVASLPNTQLRVDNVSGKTIIEIGATVDRDGTIKADCGIQLKGTEYRASATRGGANALPEVHFSERSPTPVRMQLARTRRPQRATTQRPRPTTTTTTTTNGASQATPLPRLPVVRVRPADILGMVQDTDIQVSTHTSPINLRLAEISYAGVKSVGPVSVSVSYHVTADVKQPATDMKLRLAVKSGTIAPNTSRLTCEPPFRINVAATGHAGVLGGNASMSVDISGFVIRRDIFGNGYLYPDIEMNGLLPDTAEILGYEEPIKRAIGDAIASALLGDSKVPLDSKRLMALLGTRIPELGNEITFDPNGAPAGNTGATAGSSVSTGTSTATSHTAPPSTTATPTAASSSASSAATGPTVTFNTAGLLTAMNLERAKVSIGRTQFSASKIDLGGGQSIELVPGSALTVSGSANDFVVEGQACIGKLSIGSPDMQARLANGKAQLRMHVVLPPGGGEPRIELEVKSIEATGVAVESKSGGTKNAVTDIAVHNGGIKLTQGGGQPSQFSISLPDVTAHLAVDGITLDDGTKAGVSGDIKGGLTFENGRWSAQVRDTALAFKGLTAAGGGTVQVRGDASLRISEKGEVVIETSGANPLTVGGDVALADGSTLSLAKGTVRRLVANPGETIGARLEGLSADASGVIALPATVAGREGSILDLRSGHIEGTLDVRGAKVSTDGELRIKRLSASVTQVKLPEAAGCQLDLAQVDVEGDAFVRIDKDGSFSLRSATSTVNGTQHAGLKARANASDVQMHTTEPQVHVDLMPNTQAEFELERLSIPAAKDKSPSISLLNGRLFGSVEGGSVSVGGKGTIVDTIPLAAGTQVSLDLGHLRVGEASHSGGPEVDATVAIDGNLAFGPGAEQRLETLGGLNVGGAQGNGRVRFVMHAVAEGPTKFSAAARLLADGEAKVHVERPAP